MQSVTTTKSSELASFQRLAIRSVYTAVYGSREPPLLFTDELSRSIILSLLVWFIDLSTTYRRR